LIAVSGLETLPPDQRAVLQLILVQGRGYADLAATLRLDPTAVRERAHAGASALADPAGGGGLDADTRARVVDYLLGQQDDGQRIVTFAELGESPAACRWAQALRAQLAPVAREQLPEVPASAVAAVTSGSVSGGVAVASASPVAGSTSPAAPPAPPHLPRPTGADEPTGPRPSRLGGAVLIAGAVALAIVLAIVLIGGDDDDGSPSATSTSGAQTQPQTQAQASPRTQTTGSNARTQARTVGGAVLRPASGGSGLGAALVQQFPNGRRLLAVQAARLPANAAQEFYAIWLQGAAGNRFLGFVPNQVRANGAFTVSSGLPRSLDLSGYSTVLITREGASAVPTTPGSAVLSGPLRLAG
jgi:Sigma-70, region 4